MCIVLSQHNMYFELGAGASVFGGYTINGLAYDTVGMLVEYEVA